jgi:EAL domain-containing protein (putative c-di-GMP-specific phosphodiesterase class I)
MLEITETALLRATPHTLAALHRLRDLGVKAVIDDFGTGYFSLSHLRQFPVDSLKVASEFVHDSGVDSRSSALASAIVAMGKALDLTTVAEGIESADQLQRMRTLGCLYGQGFYFARPMPLASIESQFATATGGTRAKRGRRRVALKPTRSTGALPAPGLEAATA